MCFIKKISCTLIAGVVFFAVVGCRAHGDHSNDTVAVKKGSSHGSEKKGEGTVIARVGDTVITDHELQMKIDEIPSYARKNFETRDGKMKLLERIVRTELLLQAAEAENYGSRPDIQEKIEEARTRILTSEYFKNEMSRPDGPDEAEMKKYYENHKEDYRTEAQVDVSHILVNSEKNARDLFDRISNGDVSFEEAVREHSIDKESMENEGSIGTVRKGGFIKGIGRSRDFDNEVFDLKEGEISRPIKSRRGWHIFKVNDIQSEGYLSYEEVKDSISDELMITESVIRAEYEANPEEYRQRRRAKIRHIQLETREKADEVHSQLKKGADFTELVKSESKDEASVRQDGSLGYLYEDGYIRGIGKDVNFEKSVFAVKEGDFSQPIQSKNGWHIVMVEEKFDDDLKPFDEVKTQIKNKLLRDMKQNAIDNKFEALKKKFNTEIYEDKL